MPRAGALPQSTGTGTTMEGRREGDRVERNSGKIRRRGVGAQGKADGGEKEHRSMGKAVQGRVLTPEGLPFRPE